MSLSHNGDCFTDQSLESTALDLHPANLSAPDLSLDNITSTSGRYTPTHPVSCWGPILNNPVGAIYKLPTSIFLFCKKARRLQENRRWVCLPFYSTILST